MRLFVCPRCGYKTDVSGRMKAHLARKTPCKTLEETRAQKTSSLTCPHCSRTGFSTPKSLAAHVRVSCHGTLTNPETTQALTDSALVEQDVANKEIEITEREIPETQGPETTGTGAGAATGATFNISCGPGSQVDVKNIVVNNHFTIRGYGDENLAYMTSALLTQIATKAGTAVGEVIEKLHFHPRHPENRNVLFMDSRGNHASVYRGNRWVMENKQEVLGDLVDKGYTMLDLGVVTDALTPLQERRLKAIKERYESRDPVLMRKMLDQAKLLIHNKSRQTADLRKQARTATEMTLLASARQDRGD